MPFIQTLSSWLRRGGRANQPAQQQQQQQINYDALVNAGLVGLGYPASMQKAFLITSDSVASPEDGSEVPTVVMSRSPGGAGTTLINEGYDLKGYPIKAKSCNWGPMAGFICQHTALNKKGKAGIAFNFKKHKLYLKWRTDNVQPKTRESVRLSPQDQQEVQRRAQANNWGPARIDEERDRIKDQIIARESRYFSPNPPFIQIEITETRRKEVFGENPPANTTFGFQPTAANLRTRQLGNDQYIGVACDNTRTCALEFMLLRDQDNPRWKLYFYEVYVLDDAANAADRRYVRMMVPHELGATTTRDVPAAGLRDAFGQLWAGLNLPRAVTRMDMPTEGNATFTELHGVVNPYLAYIKDDLRYLNAISGDYDLFGVWPQRPRPKAPNTDTTLSLLSRTSELNCIKTKATDFSLLFGTLGEQLCHVSLLRSPNVLIDIVPDYAELELYENPDFGNINELGYAVAQTLNSVAYKLWTPPNQADRASRVTLGANRAFHSDEGGRPQIDEVEWPVGVFLSADAHATLSQTTVPAPPGGLGDIQVNANTLHRSFGLGDVKYGLFVWMITALAVDHYVSLNKGWAMELCYVAMTTQERQTLRTENNATYTQLTDEQRGDVDAWLARRDAWHGINANAAESQYVRQQLSLLFVGPQEQDNTRRAAQEHAFSVALRRVAGLIYQTSRMNTAERITSLIVEIPPPGNGGN